VTSGVLPLPVSFALAVRGYDREQVDEHLAELHDEIRLLTVDRDAAVAAAENLARSLESTRAEAAGLRARLKQVLTTPDDPAVLGERVRQMLELARAEADEVVRAAQRRATGLLDEATEAQRRTAARLRAIDDVLARAEDILADEPPGAPHDGAPAKVTDGFRSRRPPAAHPVPITDGASSGRPRARWARRHEPAPAGPEPEIPGQRPGDPGARSAYRRSA
jgi:DivIVA domain-containing protein